MNNMSTTLEGQANNTALGHVKRHSENHAHYRTNITLIPVDRELEGLRKVFEKRTQKLCALQVGKA